ncbi:MAG: hypothetical protein BGO98_13035 [Myxococcales bacterium 68-20]|nr:MAG: hypothetical protein BGO98_13035 [Myxococcales bacterium 68-20]
MPRIDERSGDIIIRIVYDGMPEAGKTTNIQHSSPRSRSSAGANMRAPRAREGGRSSSIGSTSQAASSTAAAFVVSS